MNVLVAIALILACHRTSSAFIINSYKSAHSIIPVLRTATTTSRQSLSSTILWAGKNKGKNKKKANDIAVNRKAYRDYEVVEKLEVGISLKGTEVKSIRAGKMSLNDGFAQVTPDGRGCELLKVHIAKYDHCGSYYQHEETRKRQLLMHKHEAARFKVKTEQLGMSLIPLRAYYSENRKVKFELGLCKKKNDQDKRQQIRDREDKRDIKRAIKNLY